MIFCAPEAALAQKRNFDIPSQPANRAIPLFARQAGIQIVAPGSRLRNVRTKAVKGQFEPREALDAMLAGTGIRIVSDADNTIALAAPADRSALAATRRDAVVADRTAPPPRAAADSPLAQAARPVAIVAPRMDPVALAKAGEILVT